MPLFSCRVDSNEKKSHLIDWHMPEIFLLDCGVIVEVELRDVKIKILAFYFSLIFN